MRKPLSTSGELRSWIGRTSLLGHWWATSMLKWKTLMQQLRHTVVLLVSYRASFRHVADPINLDVNRKDYRAWYGLGQAYELLSMHHYALHYYQRATALRWGLIAVEWPEVMDYSQAIRCTLMASWGHVLRGSRKVRAPRNKWSNSARTDGVFRLREAIECYKRALITADPHEITLRLKLARVHKNLEEYTEAVAYHRTIIEVCQADRK